MDKISYTWLRGAFQCIAENTALLVTDSTEDNLPIETSIAEFKGVLKSMPETNHEQKSPETLLKTVFGYESFRPLQREVILNVCAGCDTLAVMPTGGGKSLCYQIPALIKNGLTVVVSPLIALMQDQVSQLEALGIPAVLLNSSLAWEKYNANAEKIRTGKAKLLYVSPEGLNSGRIQDLLHSEAVFVDCITIDEAHCISEWGPDFRPDYLEIAAIREQFPRAVCLALTATATARVQRDIISHLHLQNPAVLVSTFNRPNIYLSVQKKENAFFQLCSFLSEHQNQSGIVYCFSRRTVDELTARLTKNGINAINYHAGLSDIERSKHQNDFIHDRINVMVCTLAFGMGINKPDVRFVVHYDMPKSVEQYYQEIGRAGRDGLDATALLLYSPQDIRKIRYFFDDSADSQKAERLLQGIISYAESRTCRRKVLLSYFGDRAPENTTGTCCDLCTRGPIQESDVTIVSQKLLSCILRTNETYGISYISDILLGAKTERILENGHNRLSTWGIGKELSKRDWQELCKCLIEADYVFKSEDHSVLFVTEYGRQALYERRTIFLPVQFLAQKKSHPVFEKPKKPIAAIDQSDECAIRIAQRIRIWRRHTAEELNVPPYVIFGDKTLAVIATNKPKNEQELLLCHGIGQTKAERFGTAILGIVRDETE